MGCNNACRFCCQADLRVEGSDRAPGDILAEVRAVRAGGTVVFSGGEVTLRGELLEWVEAAKEAGVGTVVVQTNGRMLAYRKFTKRLVRAGVDVFAVALHGHTAALHDWLTRVDGSFEQALVGIRNVQSCGAVVYVNTVITRSNFRHLPDIAKMLPTWGAAGIRFHWLRVEGDAVAQAAMLLPPIEMVAPYLEQASGIARALNRRVSADLPEVEMEVHSVVAAG
jgi:MoaA/NifB/PqqE/SkfB family radical SAM enzyme